MPDKPWENADGSTNVDGFLAAYAADDNTFWRVEQGHIMNVVDNLIERLGLCPRCNGPVDPEWYCSEGYCPKCCVDTDDEHM